MNLIYTHDQVKIVKPNENIKITCIFMSIGISFLLYFCFRLSNKEATTRRLR